MGAARIIVLAIAAVAAIGAVIVMRSLLNTSAPEPIVAEVREERPQTFILTVRRDLTVGARLMPEDLAWTGWPDEYVSAAYITRAAAPEAIEDYSNAIVRTPMAMGEPLLDGKVVKAGEAGFMAAVLPSGMRAVAMPISVESGAGGFILPNDRVDVLLTREASGLGYVSEIILENVRVLAIDQTFQEVEGQQVVVGSTATLELSPGDAQAIAQADAIGRLSLALRSLADSGPDAAPASASASMRNTVQSTIQVYRYGGSRQVAVQPSTERAQ